MELKEALAQYCELREEIKDLRERIERDEIREPYLKQVLDFYNKCLKYSIE